jgi:lipopolysaccharide/colanic/teichoic acid biosynthesis glycosyltransferase
MLQAPTTKKEMFAAQSATLIHDPAWLRHAGKAIFDYLFVVPTLFLLLPLFLIIALLIKLESPGPVLHKQRVLGKRGRFFEAYNFRTTYVDGDARLLGNREKWVAVLNNDRGAADPRVTRVGHYIRRFGLEDLPRLLNILNRQMSLVGPHLLSRQDVARLGMRRVEMITSVRPGLTGMWQVRSYRTTTAERHSLEIEYINNWSLRTDLKILLETLAAIREGNLT